MYDRAAHEKAAEEATLHGNSAVCAARTSSAMIYLATSHRVSMMPTGRS